MNVEAFGQVKTPGEVTVITPFLVTGVSPTDGIDKDGGDILTITGSGFPTDPADIDVQLDDGTDCVI